MTDPQRAALAAFNFAQKYARYNEKLKRRETWPEATRRVMLMHREHLAELADELADELETIERLINERRILGSQRSLQFGGRAVLAKHARSYNCTSCYVDDPARFAQALYLLLCGAGVGYSVQKHHVNQLPSVLSAVEMSEKTHVVHAIPDTIEGWADAFDALIKAYMSHDASIPSFDFSQIRERGASISSCGGKAPGAYPLRVALSRAESLLISRCGARLSPVDASDLMCILADCVLAGGVRRSALLCLFSADDEDMIQYKSAPNWWETHAYRARANISALVLRDDENAADKFEKIFEHTRAYGEPGVIWSDSTEVTYNPCVEIGMCPTLIRDPQGEVVDAYTLDLIDPANREAHRSAGYSFDTAFQFCNLCEINTSKFESLAQAAQVVKAATILGCIQASYTGTDNDYLSTTATRDILEREYLLGVSLTGLGSAPEWARSERTLQHLADVATQTAQEYAFKCGLKKIPARVTCVKPSGNAAVNLGCASGVHPEHAARYLRRVQAPANSELVRAFADLNPDAVESSVWSSSGDLCLTFAIETPSHALTRDDVSALDFLEWVKVVQLNWVKSGTVRAGSVENLNHNVSNTCTVRANEWDAVKKALLDGRDVFGGVSCLSASGDYDYPQAPFQAVYAPDEIDENDPKKTEKLEAWALWNRLRETHIGVDFSSVFEDEDNTELMREGACSGGQCEVGGEILNAVRK